MAIGLLNELIYNANKSIAKPLQNRDRCFGKFREIHMLPYKVYLVNRKAMVEWLLK